MLSYIIRRLFLMIPTLIGVTFMVFMIIALAPGGLTAGLTQSSGGGGGQSDGGSAAIQEAYIEDRYGLNDPAVVQYVRWLSRVFPLKFTRVELSSPDGERYRPPRPLELPELIEKGWIPGLIAIAPEPAVPEFDASGLNEEEHAKAYNDARAAYMRERGTFIQNSKAIELAARDYAESEYGIQAGLERVLDGQYDIHVNRLLKTDFDPNNPLSQSIIDSANEAIRAYNRALDTRAHELAVFNSTPYPEIGTGVDGFWLGPPDFGKSFSTNRTVVSEITARLPITMTLNVIAIPIVYLVAVTAGIFAAIKKGTFIDYGTGFFFVALWSVPVVSTGVLFIGFLGRDQIMQAIGLEPFPFVGLHSRGHEDMLFLPSFGPDGFQRGWLLDSIWHMALPVTCIVYTGFAVLSKQTRAAMLENYNADYVRTARAKGVSGASIATQHVFRNSLLPIITMFVTVFPALFAGSIVVESIFEIEGMGKLAIDSIRLRDREVLLGTTFMVTIVNLFALLLADILYAVADPRISYD
ncbi:MAG: ABC transporter permease [Planctomycetota bacterium]